MSAHYKNSWSAMDTAMRWRFVLVIFFSIVSFASMLNNGFVFDDIEQIVKNPAVQSWRFVPEYFSRHVWEGVFPGAPGTYYRPLFLVWLRLNDSLFGVEPLGWHISSLMLHLYTTLLVFFLGRRWMRDDRLASWAAMLFAVHPIHAEPVAWISGSNEILFTFFGLSAMALALDSLDKDSMALRMVSWILFTLALLSKETAVVFLPIMAVILYAEKAKTREWGWRKWIGTLAPYAVATVGYLYVRYLALGSLGKQFTTRSDEEIVRMWPVLIVYYLKQLVSLGDKTLIVWIDWVESWGEPRLWVSIFLLGAILFVLWNWSQRVQAVTIPAWIIFLPIVPPLMGVWYFISNDLVHDRYLYFPSVGFCMLAVMACAALGRKFSRVNDEEEKVAGIYRWLPDLWVLVICSVLAVNTSEQTRPYHDDETLFRYMTVKAPQHPMPWGLLGNVMMIQNRYEEGVEDYRRAQELRPNSWLENFRLGTAYYHVHDYAQSEKYLSEATRIHDQDSIVSFDYVWYRLGLAQYGQGKWKGAEASFLLALTSTDLGDANRKAYLTAYGNTLVREGRYSEARVPLLMALKIGSDEDAERGLKEIEQGEKQLKLDEQWKGTVLHVYPKK